MTGDGDFDTEGKFVFVCNECGQPVRKDSHAGACRQADEHDRHRNHRDYYVLNPDGDVIEGTRERDPEPFGGHSFGGARGD